MRRLMARSGGNGERAQTRRPLAARDLDPLRKQAPERAVRLYGRRSDPGRSATHVIFWLNDALPWNFLADLARLPQGRRPFLLDKALDASRGRRSLGDRAAAATVQRELLADDGERYGLLAWCVMPTHVHVLVAETGTWTIDEIVDSWKARTASAANARRILRLRPGPWAAQHTWTDLTGHEAIEDVKSYIEHNPVITGLAPYPQAWPWSSAGDPRWPEDGL